MAELNSKFNTIMIAIVGLVVLFSAYAAIVPTAQNAGDSMNSSETCTSYYAGYWNTSIDSCTASAADPTVIADSEVPLSGLFSASGVVFVTIMAALLILVVRSFLKGKK